MTYQLIGNILVTSKIGVILPTYREEDNISKLIDAIEDLKLDVSILVIDDSSPDKTAEIVLEKQNKHKNILLYNRPKKSGLGNSHNRRVQIFSVLERTTKNMLLQWMRITRIIHRISRSFYQKCLNLIVQL